MKLRSRICGVAVCLFLTGCGEEGECSELGGTYKETSRVTYTTCPDLIPQGEIVESVFAVSAGGTPGEVSDSADPTMDCLPNSGGYNLAACTLDADVTCDHYDDQGFYLFTRRIETHLDLQPDGDYTATSQLTLSDVDIGQFCEAVMDTFGELL